MDALPIIKVDFKHKDIVEVRTAYMYGEIGNHTKNTAALIIPGSGHNQSLGIHTGVQDNYHCCLAQKIPGLTVFVQVKPNEDFRAWGNSLGKVNTDFYVNWHLNRGGSYSASYIIEAAALHKFLKSYFEKTALLGLSQGGHAALITTYLEPPDILVISSGHSVITDSVLWSGHNQIIIPGIDNVVNTKYIIDDLEIPILLTYGKEEIGLYKIEANTKKTCESYSSKQNVECLIHNGGHVFPEVEILEFLNRNIR